MIGPDGVLRIAHSEEPMAVHSVLHRVGGVQEANGIAAQRHTETGPDGWEG